FCKNVHPCACAYGIVAIVLDGVAFMVKNNAPAMSCIPFGIIEHKINSTGNPHGPQYHCLEIHLFDARTVWVIQDVCWVDRADLYSTARPMKAVRDLTDLLGCPHAGIHRIDMVAHLFKLPGVRIFHGTNWQLYECAVCLRVGKDLTCLLIPYLITALFHGNKCPLLILISVVVVDQHPVTVPKRECVYCLSQSATFKHYLVKVPILGRQFYRPSVLANFKAPFVYQRVTLYRNPTEGARQIIFSFRNGSLWQFHPDEFRNVQIIDEDILVQGHHLQHMLTGVQLESEAHGAYLLVYLLPVSSGRKGKVPNGHIIDHQPDFSSVG